jgi:uncharacterized protein YjbI with pentapeptide repeats
MGGVRGGRGSGEVPEWWRGYRPTEPGPTWSPPSQVTFSGEVDEVDLSAVPLNGDMLRDVEFAHAEVRGVELALDELSFLAHWSTFEDCVFRQRSKRPHPEGWEPRGQFAWRPTVYRRCKFVGVRLRSHNGFSMRGARFEDCVFERCRWSVNLNDVDLLRCRIVGPVSSVVWACQMVCGSSSSSELE